MNILIVVASRHGATQEIGRALADELRHHDHTVSFSSVDEAPPPDRYDAAVVGSAVYMGKWLKDARRYVEQYQAALSRIPVWLFSSGPVGPATPSLRDDPQGLPALMKRIGARGHRTFQGKLDSADLGFGERFIIWNVKRFVRDAAREGDYRDWSAITDWGQAISAALRAAPPTELMRNVVTVEA